MKNGPLLGGVSVVVALLVLVLGFSGDEEGEYKPPDVSGPQLATDWAAGGGGGGGAGGDGVAWDPVTQLWVSTRTLGADWPARWFDRVEEETLTGDGRPIRELAGATRGAACSGSRGAVAATNNQAVQAGLAVLANGGNAADAAVAVQLAMGVAQPESNGLGGGCFIVVYNSTTREVVTIDGREEAPAAFHPRVYCADSACGLDPQCRDCPGPISTPLFTPLCASLLTHSDGFC